MKTHFSSNKTFIPQNEKTNKIEQLQELSINHIFNIYKMSSEQKKKLDKQEQQLRGLSISNVKG
jgi:hypothetical protein